MNNKSIFILILCFIVTAVLGSIALNQSNKMNENIWEGYDAEWKKVDSLENQGLPKSALDVVNAIYNFAKKENNAPQIIKSVTYKSKYLIQTEEDGDIKAMHLFEDEIKSATTPAKNILQSMLAELYWNYYSANRWKFQDRTQTIDFKNDDIRTWDIATLHKKTLELYTASVSNKEELKQTGLKKFEPVLIQGDAFGRLLRPSVFDFLAHRALDFLMNDEAYITDPAYKFEINDPKIFDDNKSFVSFHFASADTASKKLLAIHLLQDLTQAHLLDPFPSAMVDLDIKRFTFARNNCTLPNKDSLYLNALISDEKRYGADSSSTRISYLIAQFHESLASKYDRLSGDEYKWEYKTAIEICDKAIAKFPNSIGGINCASLKQIILYRDLQLETEQVNVPEKPFRAAVTYKNMDTVYLRIVQVTSTELAEIAQLDYEERIAKFTDKPVYKAWQQALPDDGDHQQHIAEIKVDPLPFGSYVLLASADPAFKRSENKIIAEEVWISNISFFTTNNNYGDTDNSKKEFYVVDRTSGKPLKGAQIQTYRRDYNYDARKYNYNELKTYTTDANGYFAVSDPMMKDYYYFNFSIQYGKDFLDVNSNYYLSKNYNQDRRSTFHTYFFTDRSIYRPGQTIYFKGIITEDSFDGKTKNIATNYKTTVNFFDVNSQKFASLDLVTNDYGSFTGTFTAPQSGLTGDMRLQNEFGTTYFSVEEYKRPTFSVAFDAVEGNYALGDSVHVTGKANSYAGANIDQAKVQYRVVRNASWPYYYDFDYWWRKPFPNVPDMEITNGTTTTDAEGKFEIDFTAIPDLSIDKTWKPQFNYTIYSDVTDISGETRSSQTYVSAGYISLSVSVEVPETIYTEKISIITVSTTNLNGSSQPASGKIKIYPVDAPDKLYRSRSWAKPDKFTMTKAEYDKLFPQDEYNNENDRYAWPLLAIASEFNWNTATSDSIVLDAKNYKPGLYKLILTTTDKSGNEIKIDRYFNVLNQSTYVPYPQYTYTTGSDKEKHPGETAVIKFGSSAKEVRALVQITKGDGTVTNTWVELPAEMNKGNKSTMKDFEIPITESDRGGVNAQICFIKDGRFYSENYFINVPWDNKDLKVELETHRDKLQPGANETWKIKISGNKGEKVAAELLASMYDASLDAFKGHYWQGISWPSNYRYDLWTGGTFGNANGYVWNDNLWNKSVDYRYFDYDQLNWFGLTIGYGYGYGYGGDMMYKDYDGPRKMMDKESAAAPVMEEKAMDEITTTVSAGNVAMDGENFNAGNLNINQPDLAGVATRTNFNETAFFYPQLETDAEGNIIFSFTMPEALTRWNFKAFAHTKDLTSYQIFSSVVTQKELMIQPNMPRFLREGDEIELTAKISNLKDSVLNGAAQLELFNALTMQPVDAAFSNLIPKVNFTVKEKQSTSVTWKIKVPDGMDAIVYKVKAAADGFTDGEENALPVLTNRILVTEALPLWVRGDKSKTFSFDKLINSANSTSIRNQSLTLEYSSNPSWYAVQALPYMMEYPYECAEQVFNRYYSNSIASFIANSDPEIKRIFDSWKNNPESLTSNLEKNQELKSLLLEETPWVLQAQDETERKKRVALLFDVNRMNNEMESALNKLEKLQLPNGGWPWFKGYEDDRYITQYIVTGLAHLKQLGVVDFEKNKKLGNMLQKAIIYCDNRMYEDYKDLDRYKIDKATYQPSSLIVQYLYARSYFSSDKISMSNDYVEAKNYFSGQLKKFWTKYSLFEKGMIALIMNRDKENTIAQSIIKSLKEFSLNSDELGMYWKDNVAGYYWNQAPIETQSLMVEVFGEVAKDQASVDALQVWLLRQKQTTDWKTTKATAEACYALLLRGNNLLGNKDLAVITVGRLVVQPQNVEQGTGYFKTNWLGDAINSDFGKITVQPSANNVISWGAMYWQYFEDIDKVTSSNNQLQLTKKLFLQQNSATGPVLKPIDEKSELHIGDLVKVRIEIRVDRDMQYVHMKDMRASGFEPVNVLSEYKYQDGLGYYEATGDASTNFFISYLSKGTYVFEYPLRISHKGNFSNGITTIQCMYAPEFTSHSEGIRVSVK